MPIALGRWREFAGASGDEAGGEFNRAGAAAFAGETGDRHLGGAGAEVGGVRGEQAADAEEEARDNVVALSAA